MGENKMMLSNVELNWLGHAGFRIKDTIYNRIIYIDPFKIKSNVSADIILLTHEHFDHCSIEDLKKISNPNTIIISPVDCISKFQGKIDYKTVKILKPGKNITLGNINIEATHAYNIEKPHHPKENDWVGYIVDINSKRIYHAGDTDEIPEMSDLHQIDAALLPVSGGFVMNEKDACQAIKRFNPKRVVPMHYGTIEDYTANLDSFQKLCTTKKTTPFVLDKE